jgi:hypothetical protein
MARRCQQGRRSRHRTAQLNLSASNERLVKRRARWKDSEGLGEAGSGDGVEIGWIDQEAHKASAGKGARKQVATGDDGLVPFRVKRTAARHAVAHPPPEGYFWPPADPCLFEAANEVFYLHLHHYSCYCSRLMLYDKELGLHSLEVSSQMYHAL